jgi:hypothetical protein
MEWSFNMLRFVLMITMAMLLWPVQSFSTVVNNPPRASLTFDIVQDQFVFDKITVDSASIITRKNGSYGGLQIKLKKEAAKLFENKTRLGVGKQVHLIFNDKITSTAVLQSPLKDNLLLVGISKEDAQQFLLMLTYNPRKQARVVETPDAAPAGNLP